jgi:nucleoid-associated protein YgaU
LEEKSREAKGALKDAGKSVKGFAEEKKEKVQDAGNRAYEKGAEAKKRIDGKQVTIRKGDTLWGLARKYNVHTLLESGPCFGPHCFAF